MLLLLLFSSVIPVSRLKCSDKLYGIVQLGYFYARAASVHSNSKRMNPTAKCREDRMLMLRPESFRIRRLQGR
jgi:hypothetical protein